VCTPLEILKVSSHKLDELFPIVLIRRICFKSLHHAAFALICLSCICSARSSPASSALASASARARACARSRAHARANARTRARAGALARDCARARHCLVKLFNLIDLINQNTRLWGRDFSM